MFYHEFLDNYDLDAEGGDEYTLGQKMVHYCVGIITQSHRIACKACLAFFAGAATSKILTTTKPPKEASCLQVYLLGAINPLNDSISTWTPRFSFVTPFRRRMNYQHTISKVRNQVLPFFPNDLVSKKSGRAGFHETCNKVYINAYRRKGLMKKKHSKEEAD